MPKNPKSGLSFFKQRLTVIRTRVEKKHKLRILTTLEYETIDKSGNVSII